MPGHPSPHDHLFRLIRARLLDTGNPGLCSLVSSCWKLDLVEDHFKIYLYVAQDLQVPFAIFFKKVKSSSQSASCLAYISVRWEGKNQHQEKMACKRLFSIHVKFIFGPGILHGVGISFKTVNSVFPLHLPLPTKISSLLFLNHLCALSTSHFK